MNVEILSDEDLAWADCAFISAMVVQRNSAQQTIARCKKAGLKVVAGGPLFTSEYERFDDVDHFVLNEAELTLPAFLAFFRTSIRIGIFGKERIQYWNLVVWTLCRCPKLLPLAVTLAIHGYHFRKVCKL